jgi:hypothetical protein
MELQRAAKNVPGRSIVTTDMRTRRPARQPRQVIAACAVLLVTALGLLATTTLAPPPAGAQPAVHAESPADDPATADQAMPRDELPRTTTGSDGFVVLGAALAAITAVALVMALRNRSLSRERRRPAGWDRATGRSAGTLARQRISPRSRYSSRSRRR